MDIVLEYARKENVATNHVMQKWMLENVLELQCPVGCSSPTFRLEQSDFERLLSAAIKNGILKKEVSYEEMKGGPR